MSVRLVPAVAVPRVVLAEAGAEFPDAADRLDALGCSDAELVSDAAFAGVRERWLAEEAEQSAPGRVPQTRLVLVDAGGAVLGWVDVRHRLTEPLRRLGGHIGYRIVPSRQRLGHGTRALALALPVAARLGIPTVLITCHHGNVPSRRIIERAGAVLVDRCGDRLRYVVSSTGGAPETDVAALV